MQLHKAVQDHLNESANIKRKIIDCCLEPIVEIIKQLEATFRIHGKVLICGNGGSAADAQHIAAEFVIRLSHRLERPALPAISLATDSSIITAAGNDIGFENVFSRQVEALGSPDDALIAISTSGNSENIIRAIHTATEKQMKTIGFLGDAGGKAAGLCDFSLTIPSSNTAHIQEGHITVGHIICDLIEQSLFG